MVKTVGKKKNQDRVAIQDIRRYNAAVFGLCPTAKGNS